jgi:putative addiction module component (TIGR02574 family)
MTKTAMEELLKLPAEERLEIAQVLWESVEPDDELRFVLIPEWQRRILDERLEDLKSNPEDEQPWDDVRAEIWPDK